MEYNGITIYSDPRRGSVKRVNALEVSWYLKNIPMSDIDQKLDMSGAFKKAMMEKPEILPKFQAFQEDSAVYKEIMLATVLTYEEIVKLEDTMSVKEFDELVETCKEATGGCDAYFGKSGSTISSKTEPENTANPVCMNSPDQLGGSTPE